MKTFAAVLAAAALAAPALASCPNLCSGHGACGADDKCQCWAGYSGYDCSQRTCPQTEAWAVDSAEGAHVYAECAGKGLCDYTTGMCECFPGYEGRACERSSCPSDCSGHGKCRMIADLPAYAAGFTTGTNNVDTVYGWDEKAITACVCDGGYMGPDCSQRVCPFGDDPMTVCEQGDTEQIQVITVDIPTNGAALGEASSAYTNAGCQNCAGADNFAVRFTTYDKKTFYTSAFEIADLSQTTDQPGASLAAAETALQSMPNFAVREVAAYNGVNSATTGQTGSLQVTFQHESMGNSFGKQNLMQCPHPRAVGTDAAGAPLTTYGCAKEGCQPRIYQPRMVLATKSDDSGATFATQTAVAFSDDSVLTCPAGVTCDMSAPVDYTASVVAAVYNGHIWVATLGAADAVADANAGGLDFQDAAVSGDTQADFDTALPAIVTRNTGMTDFKYFGEITDHPESSTGVHKIDISQMMMDTSIEVTVASVADFDVFALQYIPARCNAAEDKTVDATAETDGTFTGTPLDNYDIENMECSGRGQCDRASGSCKCFEGYTGLACGDQTILI